MRFKANNAIFEMIDEEINAIETVNHNKCQERLQKVKKLHLKQ